MKNPENMVKGYGRKRDGDEDTFSAKRGKWNREGNS